MSKRKQGHSARERGDEQRALDDAPALGRAGHFLRAALALRPPEPPPMAAELWRYRTCAALRERLLRACGKGTAQSRYPSLSFERWLFAASQHRTALDEPLIPTPPADGEHAAEPGLVADLVAVGFGASKARDIALELAAAARTAVAHKARDAVASSEIVSAQRDAEAITLKSGGVQFRLHWGVYERLAALHCAALASLDLADESAALAPSAALALLRADAPKLARFHSAAFKMLLRYDALSGPGFQAALGSTHFARLGAAVELFASPFNCVNTTYGSAFYDTDAAFGSLGSCFDWFPRVTAATMAEAAVVEPVEFEANPPFVSALMLRLARMLIDARPLHTRVHLVVPSWCDQPYHAALRAAFPAAAASLERLTGAANEWIQVPDCKSGGRPHVRVVPTVTELWHLQPESAGAAVAASAGAAVEVDAKAKNKGDRTVLAEDAGDEDDEARRKKRKAERRALRASAERAE